MTNRAFSLNSDVGKQKKLCVLLRKLTNDVLSESELLEIISSIPHNKQSSIEIHTTLDAIAKARRLAHADAWRVTEKIIFGHALLSEPQAENSENARHNAEQNSAAVYIVRHEESRVKRVLHIYIPAQQSKKEGGQT